MKYSKEEFEVTSLHNPGVGMVVGMPKTGIRVTHIPTGVTVTCDTNRTQYKNKEEAYSIIKEILDKMPIISEKSNTEHVKFKGWVVFDATNGLFRQEISCNWWTKDISEAKIYRHIGKAKAAATHRKKIGRKKEVVIKEVTITHDHL